MRYLYNMFVVGVSVYAAVTFGTGWLFLLMLLILGVEQMITKAIVTLCNIVYALIIRWFMKTAKTNDKATIVGFSSMILLYALNIVVIWWC